MQSWLLGLGLRLFHFLDPYVSNREYALILNELDKSLVREVGSDLNAAPARSEEGTFSDLLRSLAARTGCGDASGCFEPQIRVAQRLERRQVASASTLVCALRWSVNSIWAAFGKRPRRVRPALDREVVDLILRWPAKTRGGVCR
jgi:hypothetical protein